MSEGGEDTQRSSPMGLEFSTQVAPDGGETQPSDDEQPTQDFNPHQSANGTAGSIQENPSWWSPNTSNQDTLFKKLTEEEPPNPIGPDTNIPIDTRGIYLLNIYHKYSSLEIAELNNLRADKNSELSKLESHDYKKIMGWLKKPPTPDSDLHDTHPITPVNPDDD